MATPKTTQQELNVITGNQIKTTRKANNLTLAQLATQLGISYQQLQKYEKGINRISASRLWYLTRLLKISVWYFYGEALTE